MATTAEATPNVQHTRGPNHVVALLALVVTLSLASTAQATTPWGACGLRTPESKEVTRYHATPRWDYVLRCGNENYGYRHILKRHRGDFQRLAFGTYQNWRDIADLSMDAISGDPDSAKPAGNDKGCLSRVIFLRNIRTNQVVRQQIIRMIVTLSDNTSLQPTRTALSADDHKAGGYTLANCRS